MEDNMPITFTWDDRPALITPYEGPREGASRVITAEEAHACGQHGPMTDFEIEIRKGAYDEETLAKLRTGEMHLEYDDYGTKWRAWHGHPYYIQMEREPWPDA
jgi:hypothetical protein